MKKDSYLIKSISYLYGVMKLFSIFLIAIICYGLYNGDTPNGVVYWYVGFIVLTLILYPLLKNNGKYIFRKMDNKTIHFSLLFSKGGCS
jgi:hypothetical protein